MCTAQRRPQAVRACLGQQAPHLAGIALRTSRCRPAEAAVHGQGLPPSPARGPFGRAVTRRGHA
eukprot:13145843-Alexandrium_andersonii.AAC.1